MDIKGLNKLTLKLSEKLFTSTVELRNLPIVEVIEMAEDVVDMQKEDD